MQTLAYAKLNLTLDVLFRRADGYHELDMLNIRVSLADTLSLSPADGILVTYEGMDAPEDDTVTKAAEVYSRLAGKRCGARVHVEKRIPAQAGLGGGSADAAGTLLLMQRAYDALSAEQLHEAARMVGADVPYCLHRGPCRVGGVGEKIEPLPPLPKPLWFVIVKPRAGISTPLLFSHLKLPVAHPGTQAAVSALRAGDARALGGACFNALQEAAAALLPEIGALCARLRAAGALGAAMTGSGSAVFGLFEKEAEANAAALRCSDVPFCLVCGSAG
ncbi:MAG TPA: 4-(cytidine 5'-diphospho)-2-C-methyl-D-erythritol kinase [Feifaniaceae bacterium]|nr:4-(cytidine 5'-diphospho)-2-C-methyl-D-erythritol kinase [Feifaniaceae bacterium]